MPFKLTVLGCGSAVPTLKNIPTAQLLNVNERFFLIDCGEGTQVQLKKYKINLQRITHIFISHLHGDHYFGLIGLINSMHLHGRKKELHIYAHINLKKIIDLQLESSNTQLSFPLFFHPISEDKENILFEDETILVENILLNHSISCSGFLFKEKTKKRKINNNKIIEYNIPHDKLNGIRDGADWMNSTGQIIKNDILTLPNNKPHRYAFCTDTKYNFDLIKKIQDVDLLYHEATFKEDMKKRADETGHSTTTQASEIARNGKVKMLMIGHFSQRYMNLDELLIEAQKGFKNTILAKPGLVVDFKEIVS